LDDFGCELFDAMEARTNARNRQPNCFYFGRFLGLDKSAHSTTELVEP
jgi:hypothetical protein